MRFLEPPYSRENRGADSKDHRTLRAIFSTVDDATSAVSQIIAAGIIPAAMELMDQGILTAVEEAFHFGFPLDIGAVLVIVPPPVR